MSVQRRDDIDGLRAIAVVSVVIFHAFKTILPAGFVGVDVFFVISGFVITKLILDENEKNNFSLKNFYIRRIKRLMPTLLLILFFVLIFGYFFLYSDEYLDLAKSVLATTVFANNLHLAYKGDYFSELADYTVLLHLWSLAVEEQFYFVMPLILLFISRFAKTWLKACVIALLILSFIAQIVLMNFKINYGFYLPFGRFWEMLLGVLAVVIIRNSAPKLSVNKQNILSAISLIALIVSFFVVKIETVWMLALPTLATFALILYTPNSFINEKILGSKLFVEIGLISYAVYLWHWVLFSLQTITQAGVIDTKLRLFLAFLSFILGYLTTRFIETPIRYSKSKSTPVILLGGLFSAFIFSGFLAVNYGLVSRTSEVKLPSPMSELNESFKYPKNKVLSCYKTLSVFNAAMGCTRFNPDFKETSLLIGDSTSDALAENLGKQLGEAKISLQKIMKAACPFFFLPKNRTTKEYEDFNCRASFAIIKNYIENNRFDSIVMSIRAPALIWRPEEPMPSVIEAPPQDLLNKHGFKFHSRADAVYFNALFEFIEDLAPFYKQDKIVLVMQSPEFNFDPRECITRPLQVKAKNESGCQQKVTDFLVYAPFYDANMRHMKKLFPQIKLIETKDLFCKDGLCSMIKDEKMLYRDFIHLSSFGAALINKRIVDAVK